MTSVQQPVRPTDCTELFALYELRGLKSHMGDEDYCFSATLHRAGRAVAVVSNDGNGGPDHLDFYRAITPKPTPGAALTEAQRRMMQEAEDQFVAATALLPLQEVVDPTAVSVDEVVGVLVKRVQNDRRNKKYTQLRTRLDAFNYQRADYRAVLTPDEIKRQVVKDLSPDEQATTAVWLTGRGWVMIPDLLAEAATIP